MHGVKNAAKMIGFGEAEEELFTRIGRVVGVAGGVLCGGVDGNAAVEKGVFRSSRTGKVGLVEEVSRFPVE